MMKPRRMAIEGSRHRESLIDAAEQLLREEGYAALSARRVTDKAGLKSQLVYYYFETMDDLILAVARRITDQRQARFEQALEAEDPLRAMWELNRDPSCSGLSTELISLAVHREGIREQIIATASEYRARQVEALSGLLKSKGLDPEACSAEGLVFIAAAVARMIQTEEALGMTDGHQAALQLIESVLARYGGPAPQASDAGSEGEPPLGG